MTNTPFTTQIINWAKHIFQVSAAIIQLIWTAPWGEVKRNLNDDICTRNVDSIITHFWQENSVEVWVVLRQKLGKTAKQCNSPLLLLRLHFGNGVPNVFHSKQHEVKDERNTQTRDCHVVCLKLTNEKRPLNPKPYKCRTLNLLMIIILSCMLTSPDI